MEAVPVIERGHNAAVFVPPVERAAAPLLHAVPRRPLLILTSDFARAADLAFLQDGLPGIVVRSALAAVPDQAVCYAGAADAGDAVARSQFRPAAFRALVIAWPEEFDAEAAEALEALMSEADRDAQRLVLSAAPGPELDRLVERYAFKAMTFGLPPAEAAEGTAIEPPVGPARYVLAAAGDFARTVALILDACRGSLDPSDIHQAPASREEALSLVQEPRRPVIVAEARQMSWLRRLFRPLEALELPNRLAEPQRRIERLRSRLSAAIEHQHLDSELLVISPLLARHDPALVAAAAVSLLSERAAAPLEAAGPAPALTRIWVGVGRKDGLRPGDIVGVLTAEVGIGANAIGRIEVRELFCLVEIRSEQAARAVSGLAGRTIRGRRVAARVDRGGTKAPPAGRRSRS